MAAKDRRGIIPNRIGIKNRPNIVEEKIRSGDLEIDFYFVRSYHSCDRGANEHMNGLIRQYVKKEHPSNTGPRKKSLGLKRN